MPLTPGYGKTPLPHDEVTALTESVVSGCTTRFLANLVYIAAQEHAECQYDWDVDKQRYVVSST